MGCGCANCHMTDDVTMAAECADISTSGFSQEEPMSESALEGYIEVSMITDITDITDILCFFILDPMTYEI